MVKAIYAGTFDPITFGHLDIIKRSNQFCDELIVGIGINSAKKTLFTEDERITQITDMVDRYVRDGVEIPVMTFQGLLVQFAKEVGATILVRGIRTVSDFEYELTLANANKILAPDIETVFLPTSPELAVVSSSLVKEVAKHGGDVSKFTTKLVSENLFAKLS